MLNPVNISLTKDDGNTRAIIIEPLLARQGDSMKNTGAYKVFKTTDDELFFTEPLLMDKTSSNINDNDNPDYLGVFNFNEDLSLWNYNGNLLSVNEQQQVADYIKNV